MDMLAFERLVRSESAAKRYLLDSCAAAAPFDCPSCGGGKLYVIEGGARRRCARCGRSFHPWSGRWINEARISARTWLWIVKLFELDLTAWTIAAETGASYPTVLKALDIVRRAIDAERERAAVRHGHTSDAPLVGSIRPPGEGPRIFEAVAPEAVRCALRLTNGCFVAVDRSLRYTSVSCCGRELPVVDRGDAFPFWRIFCEAGTGFWQYSRERLAKHHGVSGAKLALYIGEFAYRYSNRRRQLFDPLVALICGKSAVPRGSLSLISP